MITKISKNILTLLVAILLVATFSGCGGSTEAKKTKSSKSKQSKQAEKEDAHNEDAKTEEKASEGKEVAQKDEKAEDSKKEKSTKDSKESAHGKKEGKVPSADAIWADLMKGNQRFVSGKHTNAPFAAVRRELTKGQHPNVIILGCADSRVPPELVFDKNLGDLFVIRAAGNIADAVALGSIEYAVEHLHSSVLVVLGHESCGAVAAALSGEEMPTSNLRAIVERIAPAFEGSSACPMGGKINMECVQLNVRQSAKDVLMKSPIIKEAVEHGKLTIVRAVYKLETGEVVKID